MDKGDAIKLETSGNREEIVQEPDVSLEKMKIGEPDIGPGRASSLTATLVGCVAALNKLCDTPSGQPRSHCIERKVPG